MINFAHSFKRICDITIRKQLKETFWKVYGQFLGHIFCMITDVMGDKLLQNIVTVGLLV